MKSEMKAYYYQKKTAAFPMPTFILFFYWKGKFALVLIRKEYTRASSGGQNTRIQDTFLSFHSVQCGESNCILFEVGAQEHSKGHAFKAKKG